jgi:hypothetical protein
MTTLPTDVLRIIYGLKYKMESWKDQMLKYHKMYDEMNPSSNDQFCCARCLETKDMRYFQNVYFRPDVSEALYAQFCIKCEGKVEVVDDDPELGLDNHLLDMDEGYMKYNPFLQNQKAIEDHYKTFKMLKYLEDA